ncbi:MFS transporter [Erysiphe necator]|uniref:Putative mfs monocarboxylate transporter n=1 Tax=Uncinula necator TaxID=52586 RepID=A0A0B1NWV3_UNCNE|nr:MFS transporter [Erysiphe necator]KHJ30812.1 putative mfs monocarboxylate transporter [Erysiphe necator]
MSIREVKTHVYDVEDLSSLESTSSKRPINSDAIYDQPPDGGWFAWLQAGLCALIMLNTWGLINSFGVFQTYYHQTLLPNNDHSSISWIGSLQVFLLFFIGAFSGNLLDMGFSRSLFLNGSLLIVIGLLMTSFATTYWQLFFSQGICIGLGNGLLFCPSLSVLTTYFTSKRSIAMGICASGSAIGGIIFPALFSNLLPVIGFSWTIRAAALIEFVCLAICNIGLRSRVPPKKSGGFIDIDSLKDKSYILFTLGMFFNLWGVYFAAHYISLYASTILKLSSKDSSNLLMVLNGIGLIGRIAPNFLADFYAGSLNVLIIVCILSGIMNFCWVAVSDRTGLYSWAVFYGIVSAAVQSLYPAALSNLTKDMSKSGTRTGMVLTFISLTALTGAPIAGELIERQNGKYMYAQVFSGLSLMIGSGFLIASRMMESRKLAFKI